MHRHDRFFLKIEEKNRFFFYICSEKNTFANNNIFFKVQKGGKVSGFLGWCIGEDGWGRGVGKNGRRRRRRRDGRSREKEGNALETGIERAACAGRKEEGGRDPRAHWDTNARMEKRRRWRGRGGEAKHTLPRTHSQIPNPIARRRGRRSPRGEGSREGGAVFNTHTLTCALGGREDGSGETETTALVT